MGKSDARPRIRSGVKARKAAKMRIPQAVKITPGIMGDVSGILDPRQTYEERARVLATIAKPGIEKFAFNVFGPSLLGSIAFAIDPYAEFGFNGAKISTVNRLRKGTSIWPAPRSYTRLLTQTNCTKPLDLSTPDLLDRLPLVCTSSATKTTTDQTDQTGYSGFISDTTRRTRSIGSDFGEMELFVPTWRSPNRSWGAQNLQESYFSPAPGEKYLQASIVTTRADYQQIGPTLRLLTSTIDTTTLADERANALAMFAKHGFGMLQQALPYHRSFDLAYNIAELKDLPMMYRETVRLFKDGGRSLNTIRGASRQFLNFKFGWESTLRAVRDLLLTPTRVAKRINYLLERRGKATSYRSKRKFLDVPGSVPTVQSDIFASETLREFGSIMDRTIELRVAINCILEFPSVTVPQIRSDLWNEFMGLNPSPEDLYNLVPWTWLADWFSGAGDYIGLIDRMSLDPSLINYGFITYKSVGNVTYSLRTTSTTTRSIIYPPNPNYNEMQTLHHEGSGLYRYKYQIRKDLTSVSGVKAISLPSSLKADQLAIVGALLGKQ